MTTHRPLDIFHGAPAPPDPLRARGFTLIELVMAMTIMAMIVMMLYWAFAMGSRVWETQDLKTFTGLRQEALFRLLDQDMRGLAAFTAHWEKGVTEFFAGGPTALFYVTRGGLGAQAREDKALFFACLFFRPNPEGGEDVVVYKVSVPEPRLLDELHFFQTAGETSRQNWSPPAEMMEEAVAFLEGAREVKLGFLREAHKPFQGPADSSAASLAASDGEHLEQWVEKGFPGQIILTYELDGHTVELPFAPKAGAL